MERFLSLKYYFIALPDPNFQFTKLTLAIGLLLLIAGFAGGYYRKYRLHDPIARKILKPYPGKLRNYGFLILFLLAVREQGIPYISMRIWWFIVLGFFLYSFGKLALTYRNQYAQRTHKQTQSSASEKYLPKKKKR